MLIAAGYAPVFPERALDAPELGGARRAIDAFLSAHEPYPALGHRSALNLVLSNRVVAPLLAGVAPFQAPGAASQRAALRLHPEGLASQIINLSRVARPPGASPLQQIEASADLYTDLPSRRAIRRRGVPSGAGGDLVGTVAT